MIEVMRGDLLSFEAEAKVNPVNCMGVMGGGLARKFREAYPSNYGYYSMACQEGDVKIGEVLVFDIVARLGRLAQSMLAPTRYIINFPTKREFWYPSRLSYIDSGLDALVREVKDRDISSVALPALGCGLGGLEWQVVLALIHEKLGDGELSDVSFTVFEPMEAQQI